MTPGSGSEATTITHQPIMVAEVLQYLRPAPGQVAVDCTLGGGGHARAILERVQPGGHLIGLDVDSFELPRTEAHLRAEGFGLERLTTRHASFARLPELLASEGRPHVDLILADLGVSAMQHDTAVRGFSYKHPGPLDLRMDPAAGDPASDLLARMNETQLAAVLTENADEPHAGLIAHLLKQQPIRTTHAFERVVRLGLTAALPALSRSEVKMSVRRSFQALRIVVNDEFAALEALLRSLPQCLAPGGRVAILTFHSGEDRRVKKAFQAGRRAGAYAAVATNVVRSAKDETWMNRRAASAKLRWAVRAQP
ncbi:MAG: 16S rRNA (cytosine(1402)-N(4))-methyltransferase RsmH [Acidobacteriota bacterium]|nr:16S rRNA (cytosine(1402)-N(4))-methyltransferase RsmH [Acidobacteriota bacterium]